jgi:hypothetical protein
LLLIARTGDDESPESAIDSSPAIDSPPALEETPR